MILAQKKTFNIIMIALAMMLFGYTLYSKKRADDYRRENYAFGKEVIAHTAPTNNGAAERSPVLEQDADPPKPADVKMPLPNMTFAELEELKEWDKLRGYTSAREDSTYEAYSDQNLTELSIAGDITAMMVLAERHRKNGNRNAYTSELYKAAVHGATTPFVLLALDSEMEMLRSQTDVTPDGREIGVIEVMAYYKAAAMRGDPRASIPYMNSFRKGYERRYKEELVLTPDYLDKIDLRAQAIYDDMQATRRKLGLGEFDNSTPPSLKKSYGLK